MTLVQAFQVILSWLENPHLNESKSWPKSPSKSDPSQVVLRMGILPLSFPRQICGVCMKPWRHGRAALFFLFFPFFFFSIGKDRCISSKSPLESVTGWKGAKEVFRTKMMLARPYCLFVVTHATDDR